MAMATVPEAVQIVNFKSNGRAILNDLAVEQIIQNSGIEDKPTLVIPIGGVTRTGKSFLQSLIGSYLSYLEKNKTDDGWETSDSVIQGFQWARSRTAVTMGMWMQSRPYVIPRDDGSEVAVLLADSQGTGDNKRSDSTLDTQIMHISLQMASIQLVNIRSDITSHDLENLELCTEYSDMITLSQTKTGNTSPANQSLVQKGIEDDPSTTRDPSFKSLVFVLRDSQLCSEFGEDKHLFSEMKKQSEPHLKKRMERIEASFEDITAFTLPHPGQEIAFTDQKVLTVKDIPQDLLMATKLLCQVLVRSSQSVCKLLTGRQHYEKFVNMKIRQEFSELPAMGYHTDSLQEAILSKAYKATIGVYSTRLEKAKNMLSTNHTEAELLEATRLLQMEMLLLFEKKGCVQKYGDSQFWSEYVQDITSMIEKNRAELLFSYRQQSTIAMLQKENLNVKINTGREKEKFDAVLRLIQTKHEDAILAQQKREKERDNQQQLDELFRQMRVDREEHQNRCKAQDEKYELWKLAAREERSAAEQVHTEQLNSRKATMEQMKQHMEHQRKEFRKQIEQMQKELDSLRENHQRHTGVQELFEREGENQSEEIGQNIRDKGPKSGFTPIKNSENNNVYNNEFMHRIASVIVPRFVSEFVSKRWKKL